MVRACWTSRAVDTQGRASAALHTEFQSAASGDNQAVAHPQILRYRGKCRHVGVVFPMVSERKRVSPKSDSLRDEVHKDVLLRDRPMVSADFPLES